MTFKCQEQAMMLLVLICGFLIMTSPYKQYTYQFRLHLQALRLKWFMMVLDSLVSLSYDSFYTATLIKSISC